MSLKFTVDAILDEICDNLFNDELKEALRVFLPNYIKYLAYRIETERKLVNTLDKLEGVAWRDIPEVFQSYSSQFDLIEQVQFKYYVDYSILTILPLFSFPEIKEMFEEAKHLMKKKEHDEVLYKLNANIELEPDNLNLIFLKAILLSISNRHQEAIRFLKGELKNHPNKTDEEFYITYNLITVYCHITLAAFDEAIKIGDKFSSVYTDHPISYLINALIWGYKIIYQLEPDNVRIDQVLDDIDQAISLEENDNNKAEYYHFKSFFLKQLKEFEDAVEAIDTALELDPKDLHLHFMKFNILYDSEKIDEVLELIDDAIKLFPEKETKLMTHKAYIYKKKQNYDKGLEIVDDLWERYPKDLNVLNNKVYYHLYLGEKEEAIKAGKLLTELAPEDGNFHDSYGEVLTEFGEYEEAVKVLQKALELDPLGWFTYNTYFQVARCYKELGEYDLARESIDRGVRATNTCFCGIEMREESKEKKLELLVEIEELEKKS